MSERVVLTGPEPPVRAGTGYRGLSRGAFTLFLLPAILVFVLGFVVPLATVGRFAFDRYDQATGVSSGWGLDQIGEVLTSDLYRDLLLRTLMLAAITTVLCALLSYPLALAVTRGPRWLRGVLLAVVVMPLLTSVVVKTFGWSVLLGREGWLQGIVDAVGIPVQLLFTTTGVVIGLVHTYLPFMALSLITAVAKVDRRTEEAATSLGSRPLGVFFKVTFPQTLNGLAAGTVLTFVTSMSALVTPQLLGGGKVNTIVTVIYSQATAAQDWALASALGLVLLMITLLILSLHALAVRRATSD